MKWVLLIEYKTPKDVPRFEKLTELQKSLEKKEKQWVKDGLIGPDVEIFADNTGRILYWFPFESMEKFGKFYDNEEVQKLMAMASGLLDDISIRLLRPGLDVSD